MPQTISPWDVLTSSDRYPEREKSDGCTSSIRIHAADTAERVSKLLDFLGFKTGVSSGLRFPETLASDAAKSAHFTGEAVDLVDPQGAICRAVLGDPSVLTRFDLYMENPHFTPTWCHLQTRRTASGSRVFNP